MGPKMLEDLGDLHDLTVKPPIYQALLPGSSLFLLVRFKRREFSGC